MDGWKKIHGEERRHGAAEQVGPLCCQWRIRSKVTGEPKGDDISFKKNVSESVTDLQLDIVSH